MTPDKKNVFNSVTIKDSIALHLLKVVFSLYLGVTITLTLTHMSIEYLEQKQEILNEFLGIQESFEMPLSNSLWEYFDIQLESILTGMNKLPNILGVKILDASGDEVMAQGMVHDPAGLVVLVNRNNKAMTVDGQTKLKTYEFPLTYLKNGKNEIIGKTIIFYDANLAYQRVKLGFLIILINSALKTAALWGIFLYFSRRILTSPLAALTQATEQIELEHLTGKEHIHLKTSGQNELKILEEAFNRMLQKLYVSKRDLAAMNLHLEEMVQERTSELDQAMLRLKHNHKELEYKHRELMQAQSQLVQSEKMASLGTLVAGIAHEINNPTNFVYVNSRSLQEYLERFQVFLTEMAGGENADPEITDVFQKKFAEMYELISDINEGSNRIKTLVIDLRRFSRLEEAERKEASIEEGIRATLRLIQSKYKNTVKFITSYNEVPPIECWPAQLNQVFMNIIVNACQTVTHKFSAINGEPQGEVSIETFQNMNWVGVRIQDNGNGIPHDVQEHIFDPFFTTKPVGEGTGLGLSISYGIIEKHKGKIEVSSTPEEGTTFTIFLPKQ